MQLKTHSFAFIPVLSNTSLKICWQNAAKTKKVACGTFKVIDYQAPSGLQLSTN
jgi:hypothetical protein